MGKVDDEGFVFVEDRIKDMIISGGENIYSPEIERVLAEHPAVMEVAIIGVPDDRWGETVKAVVALKPDTTATEEELIAYCREHLATTSARPPSTSSTPCRATRPARSSSATCASPTGRAGTGRSSEAAPGGRRTARRLEGARLLPLEVAGHVALALGCGEGARQRGQDVRPRRRIAGHHGSHDPVQVRGTTRVGRRVHLVAAPVVVAERHGALGVRTAEDRSRWH